MARPSRGKPTARIAVTGEFHPSLENALLDHLADRIGRDAPGTIPVAVPTNLLRMRLSRILAARVGGHVNVRFVTLKDLAHLVTPLPLAGNRALLPEHAERLVVRRLLAEGAARGGYFDAIADRPGLAAAVSSTIRDLKEACYDPASFEAAAKAANLIGRSMTSKLADFTYIWRAYEKHLEQQGWADDLDLMRAAADTLASDSDAPLPPLVLYGFYDLNSLQRLMVARYADRADTTVFFPYHSNESYAYAEPTLSWLVDAGFERVACREGDDRDVPLPEKTILVSAPGESREAREDVRALVRILEESGLSFQETAVLMRTPDAYADLFAEELCHVSDTPYADVSPPLARTRTGRSLIKLVQAVLSDFGRTEVMEFLALADLEPRALPGDLEEAPVASWNRASIAAGVVAGADGWVERLRALAKAADGRVSPVDVEADQGDPSDWEGDVSDGAVAGDLAESAASLAEFIEELLGKLGNVPSANTIEGFLDYVVDPFTGLTRDTEERTHVLAAAFGMRALSDIVGLVDVARFAELLTSRLQTPVPKASKFGQGGPNVLGLMTARGLSHRAVVVPGLVEKAFPMSRRQDPILLDAERERLNKERREDPLGRLPIGSEGIDEERLLFRLAVASATDVIVLSFPRLDPVTARPRIPSVFLLRTLKELTGEPHDYEALEKSKLVKRIPLSRRFPERRADALTREEFDGCSVLEAVATGDAEEIAYLLDDAGPIPRRLEMEGVRWGSSFFTRYDAAVSSKEARAAAQKLTGFTRGGTGPGQTIGATSLEQYAGCPFSFFMRHVLGIEPIEEPEEGIELTPKERGSLYHAVLERFMRRMRAEEKLPFGRDDVGALFTAAERATRAGPWSLPGYPGARLLALEDLRANLARWFAFELGEHSPYVPSFFEARFGGKARRGDDEKLSREEGVPFEAVGSVRVDFGGKIDRIDLTPDGKLARVIDYKTGRVETAGKKGERVLDGGRRLQLPVYVLAAREMLSPSHPEATVEASEYRYVTATGGTRTLTFGRAQLAEREGDLRKAIGFIVKGMADGMFFPWPEDKKCRNCDYADACGVTALPLALMKYGDKRAAFFTKGLADIP